MKIYNIANAEQFMGRVLNLKDEAYSVKADGQRQDLKEVARFLISSGMARQLGVIRELDVKVEDESDAMRLISYAMEMNCGEKIA